jgi:SEC-C motif-containing protein
MTPKPPLPARCPCGGPSYDTCCGPLHCGDKHAATAVQLMRSRYSAFALHDDAYLLRTWRAQTRPRRIDFDPDLRWIRLEVLDTAGGQLLDTEGAVEFDAHYVEGERRAVLHERSLFLREHGAWVYVGPVAAHIR